MRVFKNKAFNKWAAKEGLSDKLLLSAIDEIAQGLVEADLGGHVFKKRVAVGGRGKSGGFRTLLAYRAEDKAFFVYGFAKSARSNISAKELAALKGLAAELLGYSTAQLNKVVKNGALVEVVNDG